MKLILVALIALAVGIAAGVAIERRDKTNKIELRVGVGGKITPYVKAGDTIHWRGYPSGSAGEAFSHTSICKSLSNDTCVVKDAPGMGIYVYHCTGCIDPGIGYDDSRSTDGSAGGPARAASPSGGQMSQIYCDGGTAKADDVTVSPSDTVEWDGDPGPPSAAPWQVSGLATVCQASSFTDSSGTTCQVTAAPAMPTAYHYTVHANGCAMDGMAMITVK
jgi:hypothetical protein